MQNSRAVIRIKTVGWTIATLIMITVWNLWLHDLPSMVSRLGGGTGSSLETAPTLPWVSLLIVAILGIFVFCAITLAERVAIIRTNRADKEGRA